MYKERIRIVWMTSHRGRRHYVSNIYEKDNVVNKAIPQQEREAVKEWTLKANYTRKGTTMLEYIYSRLELLTRGVHLAVNDLAVLMNH